MKLYRGMKSSEFSHFTPEVAKTLNGTWAKILKARNAGDFAYPHDLNDEILEAAILARLQLQHFTDKKEIAESYAKENKGVLVEIDVPVTQILKHFTIEFQSFAQRKKTFEVVYVVDAKILYESAKKWKFKVQPYAKAQDLKW